MDAIVSMVNTYYHEPYASLVNGIILGRDLFVTDDFKTQLKDVGLIHIVVLSGQNITLLATSFLSITTPVVGRRLSLLISIIIVVLFVWFVGAEAPAVRAGIMGVLSLVGKYLGRKTIPLYLLFLSAIIMIVFNPSYIKSISFQLSFAATFGIIIFGTTEKVVVKTKKKQNNTQKFISKTIDFVNNELRTSLSAQFFTVPIIFWYFRQISFISPVSNLLTSFIIAPIMGIGSISIIAGLINWHLGYAISWLLQLPLSYMVFVVEKLSKIPWSSAKF